MPNRSSSGGAPAVSRPTPRRSATCRRSSRREASRSSCSSCGRAAGGRGSLPATAMPHAPCQPQPLNAPPPGAPPDQPCDWDQGVPSAGCPGPGAAAAPHGLTAVGGADAAAPVLPGGPHQAAPRRPRHRPLHGHPSPPLPSLSPRRAPSDAPPTPFPEVSSAGSIPLRRDQERVPIRNDVGMLTTLATFRKPHLKMHAMRRALERVVPWVPLQGKRRAILFDKMKSLFCVFCQSRARASDCSVTTVRVPTVDRRRGWWPLGSPIPRRWPSSRGTTAT